MTDHTSPQFAQAQQLANLGFAIGGAQAQSAAVPNFDTDLKVSLDTFLPPGADASYVDRMIARAQGNLPPREVVRSTDFKGPMPVDPGILSEVRSPAGALKAGSEIQPTDTVPYLGTRIAVSHAERLGLIIQNSNGGYRLAGDEAPALALQAQIRQQQEPEFDAAHVEAMRAVGDAPDEATTRALEQAAAIVPGPAFHELTYDAAMTGQISLAAVTEIGARSGMSPEASMTLATSIYEGLRRQADAAVMYVGVPASEVDELYRWAERDHKYDHANAVRLVAVTGDTGPIKNLAQRYMASRRAIATS